MKARGYLNLGDASGSAQLYRQVLASGLSPRNRVSYGAGLADALLKQGARQEAVAAAMDVLSAIEGGVTSMRYLNRLRLIRQAAGLAADRLWGFCGDLENRGRCLRHASFLSSCVSAGRG